MFIAHHSSMILHHVFIICRFLIVSQHVSPFVSCSATFIMSHYYHGFASCCMHCSCSSSCSITLSSFYITCHQVFIRCSMSRFGIHFMIVFMFFLRVGVFHDCLQCPLMCAMFSDISYVIFTFFVTFISLQHASSPLLTLPCFTIFRMCHHCAIFCFLHLS